MAGDLLDWKNNFNALNGLDNNGEPLRTMSKPGRSRAQKRLGAILEGDALAIIVTNRRARIGLKPTHIGRYQN